MHRPFFDPDLIFHWSAARALARNLPPPVPEFEGPRVDIYSEIERRRWIFPFMQPGLLELVRTIDHPGDLIKLCGTESELRAVLPNDWVIAAPGHVMTCEVRSAAPPIP